MPRRLAARGSEMIRELVSLPGVEFFVFFFAITWGLTLPVGS